MYLACTMLETRGHGDGEKFRREWDRIEALYRQIIQEIDQQTERLGDSQKWSARVAAYKPALIKWYDDEGLPFIEQMQEDTGAVQKA